MKASFLFPFLLLIAIACSAQRSIQLKVTDTKLGMKIKAYGYGWDNLDAYLINNGYRQVGDRPMLAFSFPLEFTFIIREKKMPFGFAFEYSTGGVFSKNSTDNSFTRLRSGAFAAGIYSRFTIYRRLFLKPSISGNSANLKLSAFNESPTVAPGQPFIGGEYHSKLYSINGQIQLGLIAGNRIQYGIDCFYAKIVQQSPWALVSANSKTEIPRFTSNEKNLGISFFFSVNVF